MFCFDYMIITDIFMWKLHLTVHMCNKHIIHFLFCFLLFYFIRFTNMRLCTYIVFAQKIIISCLTRKKKILNTFQ